MENAMISDIQERLERMGLTKNPFLNYEPFNPDFSKVFINRTKELYKMNLALEYYKNHTCRNIAFIGPPRIGKTTLLHYIILQIQDSFRCHYFEYPLRFNEFCQKGLGFISEGGQEKTPALESRELGNRFIEATQTSDKDTVFIIDNFEEFLQLPDDEVEGFIRLFRRARCLFVIACTEKEWELLSSRFSKLKYAFVEEIFLLPFTLKNCLEFFQMRLSLARSDNKNGIRPFSEESIRIIGIYSFFVPGRMSDLANRVLFEALTEDNNGIDETFVKEIIYKSPVMSSRISGLNENEISAMEIMIEKNIPVSFEALSEILGVSRVAVAGYMQKLIERNVAIELDSPGKKKLFRITEDFKKLLV